MSEESTVLLGSYKNSREYIILKAWTSGYHKRCSQNLRNAVLVLLNISSNLTGTITLPLLSVTMDTIGSDNFVVIYHTVLVCSLLLIFIVIFSKTCIDKTVPLTLASSWKVVLANALSNVVNFILVVYASPPSRTPPYLQSILFMTAIPFTVLLRLLFLRKGMSAGRGISCAVIVVGLFISSEPQIWGLKTQQTASNASSSLTERILWPLCFALGFIPFALVNLTCEKELTRKNSEAMNFILWSQIFQMILMTALFWTDFIPGFGMVDNFADFKSNIKGGLRCLYSSNSSCRQALVKSWLFILAFTFGTLSQYLLIQSSDGAIFAAVVEAVVGPFASLFWTLFEYNQVDDSVRWNPVFNITTSFSIGGLALMIPGVILYNYFVIQEKKSEDINLDMVLNTN
uniref:Uncharacterized protein LOC111126172 isoform X3 n=1 Tax=Crassostrea virginica TaxID=6565 RepID=A0A8B8DFK2_CRAVI|nr:uncharacterized protein LOC111126172 isoform X3 [Crassostrea virginica]XP_022326329.1 uncharacterized protein LOC111126172 isoform X3 [Crassostrea virginica]XP_022326330.1 uncharacterized protein LOC111126172 isoform X3 [Crassostrea virginica]XP_022326331.1 uncharacterized protein LOC111126172 isoform X3 [Crassostrea virginica]